MENENNIFLNPEISLEAKGLLALVLALPADKRVTWNDLLNISGKNNDELKMICTELKKNAVDIWKIRMSLTSSRAHTRRTTTIISFFLDKDKTREIENNSCCSNNACARESNYPATPEEVILAAAERSYMMSIVEATNFLAAYAAAGWTFKDGRKIIKWEVLLDRWKLSQNSDQRRDASAEWNERHAGRDPYLLARYEYYTDDQGRKWRRTFGDESAEWEFIPEYFIGDDSEKYQKSVM